METTYMNVKYKLIDNDYIELYPFITPEKIKQEFGDMSKSPRTIRRLYRNKKLRSPRKELDDLRLRSFAYIDFSYSGEEWAGLACEALEEHKQEILNRIWQRIRKYEELYINDTSNT
jgi:hypothetical protein